MSQHNIEISNGNKVWRYSEWSFQQRWNLILVNLNQLDWIQILFYVFQNSMYRNSMYIKKLSTEKTEIISNYEFLAWNETTLNQFKTFYNDSSTF